MSTRSGVHTVRSAKAGWCNKVNGRVWTRHRMKYEAVAMGRAIARSLKVEHTIHRGDGVIKEKNSYGKDSFPPRG